MNVRCASLVAAANYNFVILTTAYKKSLLVSLAINKNLMHFIFSILMTYVLYIQEMFNELRQ